MTYKDIGKGRAYNADCFDVMKLMPDGCVDMILADLPYGTTACKWDTVIPFEPMWKEFHRIAKPNAAIVLTASQPFTSALVMSNPKAFRYSWIWKKERGTGFARANFQPLRLTEDVLVFSKSPAVFVKNGTPMRYFPQMELLEKPYSHALPISKSGSDFVRNYNGDKENRKIKQYTHKHPSNVLSFARATKASVHPTQKPVALFEYLIKTYTNENDLVFDPTAGSLTTGVAAENLGRRWVCCETDAGYFEKGISRFK